MLIMGGAISVIVALVATSLFIASRSWLPATASACIAALCIWSGLHMRYFARLLARNRLYVEALNRGEIEEGTREATRYWQKMQITVEQCDVKDVPDWITIVNMTATLAAVLLLIGSVVLRWM
jgi:hypothetical protein